MYKRQALVSEHERLAEVRMVNPQMVMYEEEFNQIQTVVDLSLIHISEPTRPY